MGIFSGLFKSRDKPETLTTGSGFAFYLGGTTSGKTVTERSAMHIPEGHYAGNPMPPTTEQAVIMLSSHFYESRDG